MADATTPATVYLVGAGPGDPGLVTIRAVELIEQADVVVYDYLSNGALLAHAPRRAPRVRGQEGFLASRDARPDQCPSRRVRAG